MKFLLLPSHLPGAHMERVAGKIVTVRPAFSAELRVGAKPGRVIDELGLQNKSLDPVRMIR